METVVIDCEGVRIKIGSRVNTYGEETLPPGLVTKITDPDGDEIDGQSVMINPYVYVVWDESKEPERFSAFWSGDWYDDEQDPTFTCDDLKVVDDA